MLTCSFVLTTHITDLLGVTDSCLVLPLSFGLSDGSVEMFLVERRRFPSGGGRKEKSQRTEKDLFSQPVG